jgi:NAD(P) transhydrogenase subunit alpha
MKAPILKRCIVTLALVAAGTATVTAQTSVVPLRDMTEQVSEPGMDHVSTLFVFMLATFVGLDVIRRVSRLLHTPLMSLTNAISAIAVVGSILVAGRHHADFKYNMLGLVAIAASVTNIVSGFLITDRMLKMFKRAPKREGSKA